MEREPMSKRAFPATILVVDDSAPTREIIGRNLVAAAYEVLTASNVQEAISLLKKQRVDLIITDLKMPGASGLELVRYAKENIPETEVIMITGYPTIAGAVTAVKIGAEEYLTKPFTDEELLNVVEKALKKQKQRKTASGHGAKSSPHFKGLVGESEPIRTLFDRIEKAARADATVLISGESGTGKELVARAIHYASRRAAAPFVPVNCSGIPEGLLESSLFGYVKGAFTGAAESRAGFFQSAEGGTIFLDEIGETPLSMQVKLLRFMQEKEINMVGSSHVHKVNLRIIAATNRNLEILVQKGLFREDLFFRLNIVALTVPPLRERGDDIILLARYFAEKYANENGTQVPEFTDRAISAFLNYHWPGNVRELENAIHRIVVMEDSAMIDMQHLPPAMRTTIPVNTGSLQTLQEMEQNHIRQTLTLSKGNKTRAAEILGIDRKTLREKLKKIEPDG